MRKSVQSILRIFSAVLRSLRTGERDSIESRYPSPFKRHRAITSASERSVFLLRTVARVNCLVTIGFKSLKGTPRAMHCRASSLWYSAVASAPRSACGNASSQCAIATGSFGIVHRSMISPRLVTFADTNSFFDTSMPMVYIPVV